MTSRQLIQLRHYVALVMLAIATALPSSASAQQKQASAQQDQTIRASIVQREPFVFRTDKGFSGFSIDLMNALAAELKRPVSYLESESFSAMLDKVKASQADLAITNISITAARELTMDFTQPIFDSGLQIMIPSTGTGTGLLDAILNRKMLGLLLLAIFVTFLVGNLMWYFERDKSPYFQKSYREGMWPSFWWAMHALISGGFEEHVPRSIPGRILGTVLLISTLFLVSAFVATLTSAMTISGLQADIETVADLSGKRVGSTRGSTASNYLKTKGIGHQEFDNIEDLFSGITSNRLDAVVHDAPILAYYAEHRGKGRTQTTGQIFKEEKYGIALRDGSEMIESLNRALLQLREDGTYLEIYRKWFGTGGR